MVIAQRTALIALVMSQTKKICDAVSIGDIGTVRRLIKYEHASPHDSVDNYELGDVGLCDKLTPLHVAA